MNKKRILGYLFIAVGIALFIRNIVFTGAVIGTSITNYFSIFAIGFFVGGILLILTSKKRLEVFLRQGTYEDERMTMTDPELYFGDVGFVNLASFKRIINRDKKNPDLIEIYREYEPDLMELRESENKDTSRVAESFLQVLLGKSYAPKGEEPTKRVLISKDEKQEIRNAFNGGWSGSPTTEQGRVLRKYGFDYASGPGHGEIYSTEFSGIKAKTSSSPSDVNAGKNVGRDVINLVIQYRERKSSK